MEFIVTYSLVFAVAVLVNGQDPDCSDTILVDECGYKIYDNLMQPSRIPINEAELETYCQTFDEGEKCLREKFKACPKIVSQKTADDYFQSLVFTHDDLCKAGNGKKLLTHTPCIKEKISNITCTKMFFDAVEESLLEKKEDQLRAVCCSMVRYEKCYLSAVIENCGKVAGRSLRADIHGFVLFMIDKCLPVLSNIEECHNMVPKPLPADARQAKSILPAILQVIINQESLGN